MTLHIIADDNDPVDLVAVARCRAQRVEEMVRTQARRGNTCPSVGALSVDAGVPGFEAMLAEIGQISNSEQRAWAVKFARDARRLGHCTIVTQHVLIAECLGSADEGRIALWVRGLSPTEFPFVHIHMNGVSYYATRFDPPIVSGKN